MSTSERGRCIFCGDEGQLTYEHVFSKPILDLVGATPDASIEWNDGSSHLWAGSTDATTLDGVTSRCVCGPCNSQWMQNLDNEFRGRLRWWLGKNDARLGQHAEQIIRRYLAKLLWVIYVGENFVTDSWTRQAPEFIPLTLVTDGRVIADSRRARIDELEMMISVGAARVNRETTRLISLMPPSIEGVPDTAAVRRMTAGLCLTLPRAGIRLWATVSTAPASWRIKYQPPVTTLQRDTKAKGLSTVGKTAEYRPELRYVGEGKTPDLAAIMERALDMAQHHVRATDS